MNNIDCSGAPSVFVPGLVSAAVQYGRLEDGREAIEELLRGVKRQIGIDGKAACDLLIEEWHTSQASLDTTGNIEPLIQHDLDYKYDVFLSYGHDSMFEKWVNQVFLHRLEGYVREYLVRPIRIRGIEATFGNDIPLYTRIALARSRCLVAICYPTYFKSSQRIYEMAVMLHRERRLGYQKAENPIPLVLPVYVFDGDGFPPLVSQRAARCDCNGFISTSIEHSERGVMLDDKLIQFASEVANAINNAPPWSETFYDDLNPQGAIKDALQTTHEFRSLPRW